MDENYNRYNVFMNSSTAARLLALNREFYEAFGISFSGTRKRLQPGVQRILETLQGDESVLDLGCGNGELARALASRAHRGAYLGVDASATLLGEAKKNAAGFPARFVQADLVPLSVAGNPFFVKGGWSVILALAVLHHIPGNDLRLDFLREVHKLLAADGRFILSNWQFLKSEKLKARIQPWESAGVSRTDVDKGDYLLDWRAGGKGLRYLHLLSETELAKMADETGFIIRAEFYSDGENRKLGLYQVWEIPSA